MTQHQQIIDKCKAVFAIAERLYGVDMSKVGIRFDLKGSCAGMAHRNRGQYFMRFNNDMLGREAFDHVLNDTVPHEIAHIVCFMKPEFGRNHDNGWKRVCYSLGGSAKRCHKEEVVYAKGITFEYTSTTGHKCRVSETIHKRIQAGRHRTFAKRALGRLDNTCAYAIVGKQGSTLAKPVVRPAVPTQTPAVPLRVVVRTPMPTPVAAPRVIQPQVQLSLEAKQLMGYGKPAVPSYNPGAIPQPIIRRAMQGD